MNNFKKSERLCHFRLRDLLFKKGNSFLLYPFRVFYHLLDHDLEKIFFPRSLMIFEGPAIGQPPIRQRQNPSWPLKKVPEKALFPYPAKCLVGVSKKNFRLAVKRNKTKRLVKEAYRKNKSSFYSFLEDRDKLCLLGLIYVAPTILSYDEIESKILLILQKIKEEVTGREQPVEK